MSESRKYVIKPRSYKKANKYATAEPMASNTVSEIGSFDFWLDTTCGVILSCCVSLAVSIELLITCECPVYISQFPPLYKTFPVFIILKYLLFNKDIALGDNITFLIEGKQFTSGH